ncbi:uncharacterized protein [Equus caballus]|uniref:uncharacterized protein n=1 Tax=Equus caballus TaxID=9796 RepID=UPI0038B29E49
MCATLGCKAHLARQLLSPWKEEPLGVCRLTGKVLTPGGRRGKPEQALAGNPHTRTLPHPVFLNPFLRRREVTGFKDTWNPSLWRRQVAASDCRSRLILRSGAPPPTPHPRVTLRPPPLCYGRGAASPRLRWCAGSPRRPHPRLALLPSLPPSSPAGRSAHTGAPARGRAGGGGRCCRCRSPSPSRDCPPCCGLCGRLPLSLWSKPSPASLRSSRGEEDAERRRGAAGWGKPGSEQGAPAAERRQPGSLAPSAPATAGGSRQRDAARLLLGGGQRRLPAAARPTPARLPRSSPFSVLEDAPGRSSLSEREVRSPLPAPPTSPGAPLPAAACASPGSDAPPAGRLAFCQLATHGIDCPRLPRLELVVAFDAWPGRGARHQGVWRIPRAPVCWGPLRGQRPYPGTDGARDPWRYFPALSRPTLSTEQSEKWLKKLRSDLPEILQATWKKPPSSGTWRRLCWNLCGG